MNLIMMFYGYDHQILGLAFDLFALIAGKTRMIINVNPTFFDFQF